MIKKVSEGIYRSGRPTFEELKESVVGTVINLEDNRDAIAQERDWCEKLGILFISIPMSEIKKPTQKQLDEVIRQIIRFIRTNVLVHCLHGHERTGIAIAEYRQKVEGWSKWKTVKEALQEGCNPLYLWWWFL